jgi:hypothetical protein
MRGQGYPAPVLPGAESRKARLTITLGCPCLCSFCFEGFDRKPFREVPAEALLSAARRLKESTGAETLEVVSFNFNTHTALPVLLAELHRLFLRVNLMSQRIDILARTAGLLDLEIAAEKRAFTLGIEGMSARLRGFLHKSLETADIERALEAVHARRTREIKLFYLLTGREREEDFEEFGDFLRWLRRLRRRADKAPRLLFSFGLLVRMPFTPLRHDPAPLEERHWKPIIGRAKSLCETNGFEFRLSDSWPRFAATQLLALEKAGAHRLLELLAERGCVDAEGLPQDALGDLRKWAAERSLNPDGERAADLPFAFPFLDDGSIADFLRARFERQGRDDGYCRKGAEEERACADCLGCTKIPRKRTAKAGGMGPAVAEGIRAVESIVREKRRLWPRYFKARIPAAAAGLGQEWLDAWLMRGLMEADPGKAENVLSAREILISSWELFGTETAWFGETVVAVTARTADPSWPLGEPLDEWRPGSFSRLSLGVSLPARFFPDPIGRLSRFLGELHAPVTVRREGRTWLFSGSDKARKRKMLLEGRGMEAKSEAALQLVVGRRFPLGEFLASFPERTAARRARVEVTGVS